MGRIRTKLKDKVMGKNCLGYHVKGVRKLSEPLSAQVGLPPGFSGCRFNVVSHDGTTESLPISKRMAEVLLSLGFSVEG